MSLFKRLLIASILFLCSFQALAYTFVVRGIQVQGLQRIRESTLVSYLPVQVGQQFDTANSDHIVKTLYKTGFFSNVALLRRGNTLIVKVQERPIIDLVKISGNKAITTKQLKKVLRRFNIYDGQPYYPEKLNEIKQGLKFEYERLGRHNAQINVNEVPETRNRVAIYIKIHEGVIAKVRSIRIIGNHAFSEHKLLEQFKLTTPSIFTLFSHDDRFSNFQLTQDLQNLRLFYLNHGYLRFRVVSKSVVLTQDKKGVYITIHISEGPMYRVSGYQIRGKVPHKDKIMQYLSAIKIGAPFSRQQIVNLDQEIATHFENKGYAFPQLNVIPKLNDKNHTVFLTFVLAKGSRVYVKRINFAGNNRTQDYVLRTQLRQMEGSIYSLRKIKESKRRLANLPYLRNIQVTPVPVPGKPDQIDLNYHVDEVNAGKASLQGGYSDVDGFLYGANISEPNFMGTGKYVSLGFTHSQLASQYQLFYNNPYYTVNEVSRGFNIYYNKTTANKKFNIDTYTMDDLGGSIFYGIPLTEYDRINLGYGYDYIHIRNVNGVTSSTPAAAGTLQFVAENPSPFSEFNLTGGWSRSTLNRAIFPTSGETQALDLTLGAPIIKRSVGYYKVTYNASWYFSLGHGFVINPHTNLGYGNGLGHTDALPFYNNFYAGGITTLPGFEPNSLGPKNPNNSNASVGGNVQILGGINFIFPNYITDKLRTAIFLDAGNIFDTNKVLYTPAQLAANPKLKQIKYESVALKNLRVSTGLMVSWYLPFLGPVDVSLGFPIVKKKGDQTAIIGFTFGATV